MEGAGREETLRAVEPVVAIYRGGGTDGGGAGGSKEGNSAPVDLFSRRFWWFGRLVCLTGRRRRVRATAVARSRAPARRRMVPSWNGPGLAASYP